MPLWPVIVAAGISAWAALNRHPKFALGPAAARQRAIDELNTRLHLRIRAFRATRRQIRIRFGPISPGDKSICEC